MMRKTEAQRIAFVVASTAAVGASSALPGCGEPFDNGCRDTLTCSNGGAAGVAGTSNAGAEGGASGNQGGATTTSGGRSEGGSAGGSHAEAGSINGGSFASGGSEQGGAGGDAVAGGAGGEQSVGGSSGSCSTRCSPSAYCNGGTCKSRITEFSIGRAGAAPDAITSGPDGNLWFTDGTKIGRITLDGTITEFDAVKTTDLPSAGTTYWVSPTITAGPDGNMWFLVKLSSGATNVGKITLTGATTQFQYQAMGLQPSAIAGGPDGNLWVADRFLRPQSNNRIYVCTPGGTLTSKTLPSTMGDIDDVVLGFDGNLWMTDRAAGILTVTSAGVVTPLELQTADTPYHLALGSDHSMWFTELNYPMGIIGRVNQSGKLDEFPVETGTEPPQYITPGPRNDLWFSQPDYHEPIAPAIGRITVAGETASFPVPSNPLGIVTGPDGNIWFTEPEVGKIGRFIPP
ncbi:MAG: virginiamycin B lyase family protein [Myxococcota bacterium]